MSFFLQVFIKSKTKGNKDVCFSEKLTFVRQKIKKNNFL